MLIGIAGGIGSGKSVVSTILRLRGYAVYDCDHEAKLLMNSELLPSLEAIIETKLSLADGSLDRQKLAGLLFNDVSVRTRVNALVHRRVSDHLRQWADALSSRGVELAFVESAILISSGLGDMVGEIWHVTAPRRLRISRTCSRNGLSREAVEARLNSQSTEELSLAGSDCKVIVNDGLTPLIPQIDSLLSARRGINRLR